MPESILRDDVAFAVEGLTLDFEMRNTAFDVVDFLMGMLPIWIFNAALRFVDEVNGLIG